MFLSLVHTILYSNNIDILSQVVQNEVYVVKSSANKVFESNSSVLGQYDVRVNEKQQVALPRKFRSVLGDTLVVTKGFDGHLVIVAEKDWEDLVKGTEGILFTNRETRDVQRFFLGNATIVELDTQGRFVLPEYLRTYAGILKDVVFVGLRNFVEVWDKNKWEEQQKNLSANISIMTESISGSKSKND